MLSSDIGLPNVIGQCNVKRWAGAWLSYMYHLKLLRSRAKPLPNAFSMLQNYINKGKVGSQMTRILI